MARKGRAANDSRSAGRRPVELRRSWLFVPGADEAALDAALRSGADVAIQELEDFTAPELRPKARKLAAKLYAAWRKAGLVAGVRVNPLQGDGEADLAAVMKGRPDIVLLPKIAEPAQVVELDRAVSRLERKYGLPRGSVEIAPNIETARGIMQSYAIATASPRVAAVVGSTEDMAADLEAERSPEGIELMYARQRMHLECRAAGIVSVDCPYTFSDLRGLREETRIARRLGYRAKSAVRSEHVATINRLLTPSKAEIAAARRIVAAFERAKAEGKVNVRLGRRLIEVPIYLNAVRLIARAEALASA